jgi:hypothetical protein
MKKTICIIVPCAISFLSFLFCWHFYTVYENYSRSDDPDFMAISPFSFSFFGTLYFLLLLLAFIFQAFIALPFWNKFKKIKKMFFIKLLGIIFIACAVTGVCFSFYHYYGITFPIPVSDYINTASLIAALCFSYWVVNFFTLSIIDKKILFKTKSTAA